MKYRPTNVSSHCNNLIVGFKYKITGHAYRAFDNSTEALSELWKYKYAKPRIKQLVKKGRESKETLFYDDLIYKSWDEVKDSYLPQIGR